MVDAKCRHTMRSAAGCGVGVKGKEESLCLNRSCLAINTNFSSHSHATNISISCSVSLLGNLVGSISKSIQNLMTYHFHCFPSRQRISCLDLHYNSLLTGFPVSTLGLLQPILKTLIGLDTLCSEPSSGPPFPSE